MVATTPSSKSSQSQGTPSSSKPLHSQGGTPCKTPQSKHRLHLGATPRAAHPSPGPAVSVAGRDNPPAEHPVEVVGRIRDYPDRPNKPSSALQISSDGRSVRVRTDVGYRDFSLDGVSVSEEEDLDGFYKKFVGSRIAGVKLGAKCTVMMYGPTGSGKSHTMFGCPKQPGIVYRALKDILGDGDGECIGEGSQGLGFGSFVHVTVLEIYNEEIYDLQLSSNTGSGGLGWLKGNASKVRLEVMGGKAKNATFLTGSEAGKISREVAKVEKRRIVKSTLCNERSSRSHCMIILDVPSVGGRLMLVDMAGSENIDQAGQTGFEAKMQTAKINQGNIALKRVVESIANGDSYVPFRDSKLTMLLQDSFEDDKSKILMILCASPDPKEMHKTICTLEYGAKAKCIVRTTNTPVKNGTADSASLVLGSRIAAMDQFIFKLQMENKLKEKERDEAHKEALRKEKEVALLKAKLEEMETRASMAKDEEINVKVNERTQVLRIELERKLEECQKIANEFVEAERRRMEEKLLQQQEVIEKLGRRLEEIESDLCNGKVDDGHSGLQGVVGSNFMKKLSELYSNGDQGMEKSMDLDMDEQPIVHVQDVRELSENHAQLWKFPNDMKQVEEEQVDITGLKFPEKVCLSTVFEADEEGEEPEDEEVEKEVVEEMPIRKESSFLQTSRLVDDSDCDTGKLHAMGGLDSRKDPVFARKTRIQNIFMLCGNHRELSQHVRTPTPAKRKSESIVEVPASTGFDDISAEKLNSEKIQPFKISFPQTDKDNIMEPNLVVTKPSDQKELKENIQAGENMEGCVEVYVKWEAAKEHGGKFITKLKVLDSSTIADLRKLIEAYLGDENKKQQAFSFLMLGGDPTGAPLAIEKEMATPVSKLPICNNQLHGHLASLRPIKKLIQRPYHLPFSPLENKLPVVKQDEFFSPQKGESLSPLLNPLSGIRV